MASAVVLLSGGLDSTTALAIARDAGHDCYALTVRYGQLHEVELEAAQRVAAALGVHDHRIVTVDLSSLASEKDRIKAVIGLGSSAKDITDAFEGLCPTSVATSMKEAVAMADELAVAGDVVLLSPACASFDWYPTGGYPARGDDFRQLVAELAAAHG